MYYDQSTYKEQADYELMAATINDIGTVPTTGAWSNRAVFDEVCNTEFINRAKIEMKELEELRGTKDYLLEVHGQAPEQTAEEIYQLINKKVKGPRTVHTGNEKLDKARQVIDDLEADLVTFNENPPEPST